MSAMPRFLAIALLYTPLLAAAATPAEHDHNHGATAAASAAPASEQAVANALGNYDTQMQKMRDLHDRMMAAKTPAERHKLKQESMTLMHEGMTMMKSMSSAGMNMMDKGSMGQGEQSSMMHMKNAWRCTRPWANAWT